MDLQDLGADHLVVELERPANVLDVQEDARDSWPPWQPPLDIAESAESGLDFAGGYT